MTGFASRGSGAPDFEEYIQSHPHAQAPEDKITIYALEYISSDGAYLHAEMIDGKEALVWEQGVGTVTWRVNTATAGLYALRLHYFPLPDDNWLNNRPIEMSIALDGEIPYRQADVFTLRRFYKPEGPFRVDDFGNQVHAVQVEAPRWATEFFMDIEGLVLAPLTLYLPAGENELTLELRRGAVALYKIEFLTPDTPVIYAEYLALHGFDENSNIEGQELIFEAETPAWTTCLMLRSTYDRGNAFTSPNSPYLVMQNIIGGYNWSRVGQKIAWEIEIEEDGFYKISFRARQNTLRGLYVTRNFKINGEVPFQEAATVRFPFSMSWTIQTIGGDTPYLFFLPAGTHTLTLEVTLGDMAQTKRTITEAVQDLNHLFRRIIMITGNIPDLFRDYMLERQIPDLIDILNDSAIILRDEAIRVNELTGIAGGEVEILKRTAALFESLADRPDTIPARLQILNNEISVLGALLLILREQALELDYISVAPEDSRLRRANGNIFTSMWFNIRAFFHTFRGGFHTADAGGTALEVWIDMGAVTGTNLSSGRDMAQILDMLVRDSFTIDTGIQVNISVVSGALLRAVLAGSGPDVSLLTPDGSVFNMAIRNSAYELSAFPDFPEIAERFFPSSLRPVTFRDRIYGLPEIINFPMMFVRTDILEEMDLKVPETWDDLFYILPDLQRNNMNVGIPVGPFMFETLLLQQGLMMYTDDLMTTTFHEPEALEMFQFWTDFYTKYSVPFMYNFYNRFRIGEMPIGIEMYPIFNMLYIAAPEIRGLWEMRPIPGFMEENGEINNTTVSFGMSGMIPRGSSCPDTAWEFLKWWTSDETQTRFGLELEAMMGPGARFTPANVQALQNLPWSDSEVELLMEQWGMVQNNYQVPGSYLISRNLDNAFRAVVITRENERETLRRYNNNINNELERRRAHFEGR